MIIDRLECSPSYFHTHPGFSAAFDYLRRTPLMELPAGKHEIDGERLYLVRVIGPGQGRDKAKLEAHRRYIDIQLTLSGNEEIGWSPLESCRQVDTAYTEAIEAALFTDHPESWFRVPPGSFAVFFPQDAHVPMCGKGELHKAVMKVAVDWR